MSDDIVELLDTPNIVSFDLEMTGGNFFKDEILQMSLVSINEGVLFNEYFKPLRCKSWKDTEKIHHITVDMVKDAHTLNKFRSEIRRKLRSADIIVGYGIENDIKFMRKAHLDVGKNTIIYDLQKSFMRLYSHGMNMPSLKKCAEYCHCPNLGIAHNSLADAYTTLYCFIKLHGFPMPAWFECLIKDRQKAFKNRK